MRDSANLIESFVHPSCILTSHHEADIDILFAVIELPDIIDRILISPPGLVLPVDQESLSRPPEAHHASGCARYPHARIKW